MSKIGLITDIHHILDSEKAGYPDHYWPNNDALGTTEFRIYSNSAARFTAALDAFETAGITVAAQLGDYIDDGGGNNVSRLQAAETVRGDSTYSGSFYHVIGNWERGRFDGDWTDYENNITNSTMVDEYAEDGITKAFTFEDDGIRYIVLFGYLNESMSSDQRTWLADTALAGSTLPKVVLIHSPLLTWPTAPHTVFEGLANASTIRGLLEADGNVQAVFAGHWHEGEQRTIINGIQYFQLRCSVLNNSLATDNNAYYIIEIIPNAVSNGSRLIANIEVTAFGKAEMNKAFTKYVIA